jgi:hypothetical protein
MTSTAAAEASFSHCYCATRTSRVLSEVLLTRRLVDCNNDFYWFFYSGLLGLALRAPEPRELVSSDAVRFPSAVESTPGPVTLTFDYFRSLESDH